MRRNATTLLAMMSPLLLAGCGDPFQRPEGSRAVGVNQANLQQEVVNEMDVVVGHEDPGSDAILDATAAARLHADHPRPLPIESTTSGGGS